MIVLFLISGLAFAQNNTLKVFNDTFIPSTLTAGTVMQNRTASSSYDDTTRAFNSRGYAAIYVGVEISTNDSDRVLLSYQVSKDGASWTGLIALDSMVTSAVTGAAKYFALPANALGAYQVRVRAYSNTSVLKYSANPSTKHTIKIIRIPYNDVKLK